MWNIMQMMRSTIMRSFALALVFVLLNGCANVAQRTTTAHPRTVPAFVSAPEQAVLLPRLAWAPPLVKLIDDALAQSPQVHIAAARLEQARAESRSTRGAFLPQVSVTASGVRARGERQSRIPVSDADVPVQSQREQGGFEFRWELDLFGKLRAQTKASDARAQAAQAEVQAAQQSVAAELQSTLIRFIAATQRAALTQQLDAALVRTQILEQALVDAGLKSREELLRVRAALSAQRAQATLDALEARLQMLRMRALTDLPLNQLTAKLPAGLALPNCKLDAPDALPLQALASRPDIAASRALLAAAVWQANATQLARLPSFSLTGDSSQQRTRDEDIFTALTRFSENAIGFNLAHTLFAGGALQAQAKGAAALARASALEYRQTLLLAAEEVDAALASLQQTTASVIEFQTGLADSQAQERLSAARLKAGIDSQLDHLLVRRETLERALTAGDAERELCLSATTLRRAIAQAWPEQSLAKAERKTSLAKAERKTSLADQAIRQNSHADQTSILR
jgi:outer membrane protein, multidrug efflux system